MRQRERGVESSVGQDRSGRESRCTIFTITITKHFSNPGGISLSGPTEWYRQDSMLPILFLVSVSVASFDSLVQNQMCEQYPTNSFASPARQDLPPLPPRSFSPPRPPRYTQRPTFLVRFLTLKRSVEDPHEGKTQPV